MNIIVTGGAGYIGSHVVKQLIAVGGHKITIIDNLSTGFMKTVHMLQAMDSKVNFVQCDLENWASVDNVISSGNYDVVMHFAGSLIVNESITNPLKYYLNNTANTANLVKCCLRSGINKMIFSSTAAVYGEQNKFGAGLVCEDNVLSPINAYGRSKMFSEQIIADAGLANPDFKYVIMRYFNVAGADSDGTIGQMTANATHLIKVASEAALGKRDKMQIFGTDYSTDDGTCIRDFIHVEDLASAHISCLNYLEEGRSNIFNCGYGKGYSVRQVINTMKEVSGVNFDVEETQRRLGDISVLVADNSRLIQSTDWHPVFDDIAYLCKTTLEWEKKLASD